VPQQAQRAPGQRDQDVGALVEVGVAALQVAHCEGVGGRVDALGDHLQAAPVALVVGGVAERGEVGRVVLAVDGGGLGGEVAQRGRGVVAGA